MGYISGMQTDPVATSVTTLPKNVRANVTERVPKSLRKRGAASDYHPGLVTEIAELMRAGWTDREVADELGVAVTTLYRWKELHTDFAHAMEMNDKAAVGRVKGTLYNLANGYSYIEQEAIRIKTGADTEEVQVVDVIKHVPPNPASVFFYLKNRDRENWRDVQDHNVTGTIDLKSDVRELALALLATIKAGLSAPVIEHSEEEAKE